MNQAEIIAMVLRLCNGDKSKAARILGFIEHESSFKTHAFLNDKNGGSYGLMQLNYDTAMDRGYEGNPVGLYDGETNVKLGMSHLDWLTSYLAKHQITSQDAVTAAYNCGVGNVIKGMKDQLYVDAINAADKRWLSLLSQESQQ